MLFFNPLGCLKWGFVYFLIVWGIMGLAYRTNPRRLSISHQKRMLWLSIITLAPFLIPLLLMGLSALFATKAFFFGAFLVLFMLLIVAIRKPFLFELLKKLLDAIGNMFP